MPRTCLTTLRTHSPSSPLALRGRLVKEVAAYEKEAQEQEAKVQGMKAEGKDPYDIKKQEEVLQESYMMIPDSKARLAAAVEDLKAFLVRVGRWVCGPVGWGCFGIDGGQACGGGGGMCVSRFPLSVPALTKWTSFEHTPRTHPFHNNRRRTAS